MPVCNMALPQGSIKITILFRIWAWWPKETSWACATSKIEKNDTICLLMYQMPITNLEQNWRNNARNRNCIPGMNRIFVVFSTKLFSSPVLCFELLLVVWLAEAALTTLNPPIHQQHQVHPSSQCSCPEKGSNLPIPPQIHSAPVYQVVSMFAAGTVNLHAPRIITLTSSTSLYNHAWLMTIVATIQTLHNASVRPLLLYLSNKLLPNGKDQRKKNCEWGKRKESVLWLGELQINVHGLERGDRAAQGCHHIQEGGGEVHKVGDGIHQSLVWDIN